MPRAYRAYRLGVWRSQRRPATAPPARSAAGRRWPFCKDDHGRVGGLMRASRIARRTKQCAWTSGVGSAAGGSLETKSRLVLSCAPPFMWRTQQGSVSSCTPIVMGRRLIQGTERQDTPNQVGAHNRITGKQDQSGTHNATAVQHRCKPRCRNQHIAVAAATMCGPRRRQLWSLPDLATVPRPATAARPWQRAWQPPPRSSWATTRAGRRPAASSTPLAGPWRRPPTPTGGGGPT